MKQNSHRYWKIEVHNGLKKVFSKIVSTGKLKDKNVEQLLNSLIMKHILSDEEIICSFMKKETKEYFDFEKAVNLNRSNEIDVNGNLRISYSVQSSDIMILISLIYENEVKV